MNLSPFNALVATLLLPLFVSSAPTTTTIENTPAPRSNARSELPRLVIYFQTTHDDLGNPISMLPLIHEKHIALTHLIVCSLHINEDQDIRLNDYSPYDPHFYTLWNETVIMQRAGVKVTGMIGGADPGSFDTGTLDSTDDATFELYYAQLAQVIRTYDLQGMDLDVEQYMSQAGIERLVQRLNADFGEDFIITLAPVATALENSANLSGFNYTALAQASHLAASSTTGSATANKTTGAAAQGAEMIHFLNAQFYSGFGTMNSPTDFQNVVAAGWDPKFIVAGQLTSPLNGAGYTDASTLNETVVQLVAEYGIIGGIMGWEYFDSEPGGTDEPWEWAQEMTAILRPGDSLALTITDETATTLSTAWNHSVIMNGSESTATEQQHAAAARVDYFAMVNA
ncbi:endo-N-acetyl-beta-D-glucosaminidase precursor [Coniella lustricola]|uniref:Endo-N-acetyl-beta-D-glucosaminidase n=1 Tax=Coniella lustricola TaxID=2025994 RepID=A0A2T3A1V8_9PEZI|nr:endo-N-acetyl-beta-D-glucosaminidase precursor [Coniella lustricola]